MYILMIVCETSSQLVKINVQFFIFCMKNKCFIFCKSLQKGDTKEKEQIKQNLVIFFECNILTSFTKLDINIHFSYILKLE